MYTTHSRTQRAWERADAPRAGTTRVLATLALALGAVAEPRAQQFVYDAVALPAQTVWTNGVVLEDLDADGDVDVVFANGSAYGSTGAGGAQPQHLFLNDGSGDFGAAHAQLNVPNMNAHMVIAPDVDGDGDPDLVFASNSLGSPSRLLLNDGVGAFTDVTATHMPPLSLRSFCVCAGDVDDDGDLDLALTDGGTFGGIASQLRLLENSGVGVFTDATATRLPADLYNAQDVSFVDWDGDLDVDIALSGKGAAGKRSRLYLNDGTGHYAISAVFNALGTSNTYETDFGDLDGDGDFDAMVQSISGFNEGWAVNGVPTAPPTSIVFPSPNGGDDNEMAGHDFDNDGDLDVFVGSLSSTGEKLYVNGGGTFVNANAQIQTITDSTLDLAFHDLDGDGDYDMVTAQGESGNFTNRVYRNTGPADTLPPVFLAAQSSALPAGALTVVHCQIQDAVMDDAIVLADVRARWATDLDAGVVAATPMGGGLFRAAVPTAGASTLLVEWTATDAVGNSSTAGASLPWTNIHGLPHLLLGGASAAYSAPTWTLTNPSPGQHFGAAIDVSGANGLAIGFDDDFGLTTTTDDGRYIEMAFKGGSGGDPLTIVSMRAQVVADQVRFSVDFAGSGTHAFTARLMQGDEVVAEQVFDTGVEVPIDTTGTCPDGSDAILKCIKEWAVRCENGVDDSGWVEFCDFVCVDLGGNSYVVDGMSFVRDPGTGEVIDETTIVTVTSNLGNLPIKAELLQAGSLFASTTELGPAATDTELGVVGGQFVATGLAGAGSGIALTYDDAVYQAFGFVEPLTLGMPNGSGYTLGTYGTVDGVPGQLICMQGGSLTAGVINVSASFLPLASFTTDLELLLDGVVVHTESGIPPGTVFSMTAPGEDKPIKYKKSTDPDIAIVCCFLEPVIVTTPGLAVVSADEAVLAPSRGNKLVSAFERDAFVFTGIDAITIAPDVVQPVPAVDLGGAVAGAAGEPVLVMAGDLTPGSTSELGLFHGPPSRSAYLVLGLSQLGLPFKGGVLQPNPDLLLGGLPLDGAGHLNIIVIWPTGVAGISIYAQSWMPDATAPKAFSASNGLRLDLP